MKTKTLLLISILFSLLVNAAGGPGRIENKTAAVQEMPSVLTSNPNERESQAALKKTSRKEKLKEFKKELKEYRTQLKQKKDQSAEPDEPTGTLSMLLSLAAFLSVIGGVVIWPLLALSPILALLGIIFGFISLGKASKNGMGKGPAITGIILGSLYLMLCFLLLLLLMSPNAVFVATVVW